VPIFDGAPMLIYYMKAVLKQCPYVHQLVKGGEHENVQGNSAPKVSNSEQGTEEL